MPPVPDCEFGIFVGVVGTLAVLAILILALIVAITDVKPEK